MATEKKPAKKKKPNPKRKTVVPAPDKCFDNRVAKAKAGHKTRKEKAIEAEIAAMSNDERQSKDWAKPVEYATYNAAYDAYKKKQTIEYVATTCQMSLRLAKILIEEGIPAQNFRPIRHRYEKMIQTSELKVDYTLAKARAESIAIARTIKHKLATAAIMADPAKFSENTIVHQLQMCDNIIEKNMGLHDGTMKIETTDRFSNYTLEEKITFFKTGVAPDHDISVAPVSSAQKSSKE